MNYYLIYTYMYMCTGQRCMHSYALYVHVQLCIYITTQTVILSIPLFRCAFPNTPKFNQVKGMPSPPAHLTSKTPQLYLYNIIQCIHVCAYLYNNNILVTVAAKRGLIVMKEWVLDSYVKKKRLPASKSVHSATSVHVQVQCP